MNKFEEAVAKYSAEAKNLNLNLSHDLLVAVAKGLGPSIYNADSEVVAASDPEELKTVKNNFLIGKLGLSDGPELDSAIKEVVEKLGTHNRNKYRVLFYALLVKKFGKEAFYK